MYRFMEAFDVTKVSVTPF